MASAPCEPHDSGGDSMTKKTKFLPLSLDQLPAEVITLVSSHLDSPDAYSLSIVSRRFLPYIEKYIWNHVDVRSGAESPVFLTITDEVSEEDIDRFKDERTATLGARASAARSRMKSLLEYADRRKWGLVQKLSVRPMPETAHLVIAVLDSVSPNLRELYIEGFLEAKYRCHAETSFDFKLLGAELRFPALTHLHLGKEGIRFNGTVSLLCEWAPNLVSLAVTLVQSDGDEADTWPENLEYCFPEQFERKTRLRDLQLSPSCLRSQNGDDLTFVIELLDFSPELERVSVDVYVPDDRQKLLIAALGKLPCLHTLRWNVDAELFADILRRERPEGVEWFALVRRLILGKGWNSMAFTGLPNLPRLEILYLAPDCDDLSPSAPFGPPPPRYTQEMDSSLSIPLLGSPHLHSLRIFGDPFDRSDRPVFDHIDTLDYSGDITAHFTSYRYGEEQILYARVLVNESSLFENETDFDSGMYPDPPGVTRDSDLLIYKYVLPNGIHRRKIYRQECDTCWEEFADYQGLAVPLEVLERMRVVECAREDEWRGRGVAVGQAAWRVLLDWRDSVQQGVVAG